MFPCRPDDKRPAIRGWIRSATREPNQLEAWWARCPQANVGILTEGLVVLDADGPDAIDALSALGLPRTATVKTPRGLHVYLVGRVPDGCVAGLGRGLDVRGNADGRATHFVVGPGSIRDGFLYSWEEHPTETPVAAAPAELIERVRQRRAGAHGLARDADWVLRSGARNVSLTQVAGRLHRAGLTSEEELSAALQAVNRRRSRPPLPGPEVAKIARSAARTFRAPAPWQGLPRDVAAFCADERLGAQAHAVLRCLCDHASTDGGCWPSIDTLRSSTGLGRNAVRAALEQLEAAGRVKVERRPSRSSHYVVRRAPLRIAGAPTRGIRGREDPEEQSGTSCTPGGLAAAS